MDHYQELFQSIANVAAHVAALIGVASVVVHARVPWWASTMGRHLMAYMTVIAAVLVLAVIRADVGGETWWFALLRLITFIGVPVVMGHRLWLQIQAQRQVREEVRTEQAYRQGPHSV